jgi:hypothetical protein
MTENQNSNNEIPKKLEFHDDGILLCSTRWGARYTRVDNDVNTYLALKNEIEGKLIAGEPVYVQVLDERRKGSVGRLNSITFDYRPPNSPNSSYYNRSDHYLGIRDIEVVWDGRKNKCSPSAGEVEYLPNWSGGTQWEWTPGDAKPKAPRVIPYDSLGQEIETGQFVCFVHRRYGHISMKFGTVTRMTDRGGVFVKTLKLRDGEKAGEEVKAFGASELLIVNDKLMSRLMMARLAAD